MVMLKSVVIILTTLIALAICLLVYGLIKQVENPDWKLFSTLRILEEKELARPSLMPSKEHPSQLKDWGDINLRLPVECRFTDIETDAQRLYLFVGPAGRCHRIVIINTNTGHVLGSVKPSQ